MLWSWMLALLDFWMREFDNLLSFFTAVGRGYCVLCFFLLDLADILDTLGFLDSDILA